MRWVWRGVVALLALLVVLCVAGYAWLLGSLPQLDGELRLAGLQERVEVVRDRYGVPHIFARNQRDASFALGFVHAQDRLWQMEVNRRLAAGRLSEVIGEPTVGFDRLIRTLGLRRHAEAGFELLDEEAKRLFRAYADGVNAFLETRSGPLPLEFQILRHTLEPWTAVDSASWIKAMALSLSANWQHELARFRLQARLTPEQIREFYPPYPEDGAMGVVAAGGARPPRRADAPPPFPAEPSHGPGSNNWVVAGSRTASGKPLLANDPHLGLSTPAVWYFAHLAWPGHNVIGATFPGFPSVILGRTDRIAWGFTNTGPDVQDLYLERIDPDDSGRYLTPSGSAPFVLREEVIKVKGAPPVRLTVRETRHGPVISDTHEGARNALPDDVVLALAWTALRDDDLTAGVGLHLPQVSSWDEFVQELRGFHAPQQSIVYADVGGTIGFIAPGRIPLRRADNDIMGASPQPGWEARYDWVGYVPFDELPRAVDPASGMLASANHRIVDDGYPHHITFDWDEPYRIERIRELLRAREKHSLASFRAMQFDERSGFARAILPRLLQPQPNVAGAPAHEMLRAWDGVMRADAPEPLVFMAWYRELTRLVYADELGELFEGMWRLRPRFMRHVLMQGGDAWCDNRSTPAEETCDVLIVRALDLAFEDLKRRHGDDPSRWRWGEAHAAHSPHRPFGRLPQLAGFFDVLVQTGGGEYTVNAGRMDISDNGTPFRNGHAATLRAIYDLDDPNRSLFIHSTGQSGNVLSAHYSDMAEMWATGEYVPMTTDRAQIAAGSPGTLVLLPAGSGG